MITISNHRLVFEYKMSFFSGDGKIEFQLPLLQSSVSHDSSEIPTKKHFILLSMLKGFFDD